MGVECRRNPSSSQKAYFRMSEPGQHLGLFDPTSTLVMALCWKAQGMLRISQVTAELWC
jgi:hypothetical protein